MSALIIIVALLIVGAIGYQFGQSAYNAVLQIPSLFGGPFSDALVFTIFNILSAVVPIVFAVVFLIQNFIKKAYKRRVGTALSAYYFFFLFYTIPFIYNLILGIIDQIPLNNFIPEIIMLAVDIIFSILEGVHAKTKKDIIGVFASLLIVGYFAYRLVDTADYTNIALYFYMGIGVLIAIYSVLCAIQMKKLNSENEKEQEVVKNNQENSPKVEYEPAPEHVPGYVEEPKEGEVLPVENDGNEKEQY